MEPGEIIAGRFEIVSLAGSGAMGRVYEAVDRLLSQRVALKLMSADAPSARFEREAEVLAGLHHPNIVRYVAHGFSGTELYLAMDWLDGEDLERRLERGRLTIEEALLVATQAAAALGAAHAQGVIHRDVKPSNLFLVNGSLSDVRLVDFGLAAVGQSAKRGKLTQAGLILGTPAYMAPEQVRCESRLDARADVFSLGCVLFECLTGRCPFEGNTPLATFAKVLLEEAPRASEINRAVPEALAALVASMLEKKREGRPEDAVVLAESLAGFRTGRGGPIPAPPPSLTRLEQRLVCVLFLGRVLDLLNVVDESEVPASPVSPDPSGLARAPTMLDMPQVTFDTDESGVYSRAFGVRLTKLREIAGRFAGEVEALPDGSVVVVHGAREGVADPSARAARSALALHAAFPSVPIALSTGRSTTVEARTIGEVLDRASALIAGDAVSGGIRIDDVSRGLLEARFELEIGAQGAVLVRERRAARAERTLLGRQTVCVGRERELSTLLDLLRSTIAHRTAGAVLVSAAAGVGKSRLRYEFLRRMGQASPHAAIWVGWGDPMGAGSPFGLLAPLVRRVLGIDDADSAAARRAKVTERVSLSVPPAEALRVAEFVGELVGASFPDDDRFQLKAARRDAVLLGDQMLRAWGDFVVAEASRCPIVLVLEDIHWGDKPSMRFIDHALSRASALPVFVLAMGRPEYKARFPGLWADRSVTEIALSELDAEGSRAIVESALGPAEEGLVRAIVERAAGNAFYLEELIQAVADGRGISLPGTVLAVAQARLEALTDAERRLLRAASVFGASFRRSGVLALLGVDAERELDERLSALTEKEVFVRVGERDEGGAHDPRFAFRHALLRDAAYAMLTTDDCALGHRLAGAWLEAHHEGDPVVLAEHFERGGVRDRAGVWYGKGAAQALEANDFGGVLARVERALACGVDGVAAGTVHLLAAEAHRWCNELADAAEHACAAMTLLPPGTAAWFDAVGEAGLALGRLGRFQELVGVAHELDASTSLRLEPPVAAAIGRVSDQLLFAGEHALYQSLVDKLEALAVTGSRDPVVDTWIIYVRAGVAMMKDAGEYVAQMRLLVTSFEDLGDARNACLQRVNLGDAYIQVGHYVEAASLARESLAEGAQLGLSATASMAKCNLARALWQLGELGEARTRAAEAIAEMRAAGERRMEATVHGLLACVLLGAGELSAAEDAARAALLLEQAPPPVRSMNLARLAEVLLAQGRHAEAAVAANEAFAILGALGRLDDGEAYVRLLHAEALLACGDVEAGKRSLADARERLTTRAATMSSSHWRTLFLSNVPENAKTLALAKTWCG